MKFGVWAPTAEKVELEMRGERAGMQRDEAGWWGIEVSGAGHGTDYAYRVNDGSPLPDPRSAWQPHGVHGPSRVVDHSKFRWTDNLWQAKPLSSAVIYELHAGTFTPEGTFDGIISRLDHLVKLGVTHVELMPVADFPGARGWGYDGVALYAARHVYGGPEGLKRLVDACHAKGLGVILDVVYNHLGPSGNYLGQYGPYFTNRHSTPWGAALNFDGPQSDEVRRFFCDNALMWFRDYHIDGLRLDAIHAIIDTSAIHFLEQLATEVDELKAHLGRHLVLIAESDLNDPRVVRPWQVGGFGIDAQWADDTHHALHSVITGERSGYYADFGSIALLATAMQQPYTYAGQHSRFRQRRHGRRPTDLSGHNFLAYLQNHDQIGNRARGERMTHMVNADRVKIGAALVLTSSYVPMFFQGEEWAASSPFQYFVDFSEDPDLAKAVTAGRREEFAAFGWKPEEVPDPQSPETFERSKLKWDETERDSHASMLAWYRDLVRLRRQLPALTTGRTDMTCTSFDEKAGWLVVEHSDVSIACNFSDTSQTVPLGPQQTRNVLLSSKQPVELNAAGIAMPPESVAILGRIEGT